VCVRERERAAAVGAGFFLSLSLSLSVCVCVCVVQSNVGQSNAGVGCSTFLMQGISYIPYACSSCVDTEVHELADVLKCRGMMMKM
jgi:hypothetical protein